MTVESVVGYAWNRWSDAHGMGGQMTVESATMKKVRIELKWEWKLEGAWGATIVMVALLQLPHLPLWFELI